MRRAPRSALPLLAPLLAAALGLAAGCAPEPVSAPTAAPASGSGSGSAVASAPSASASCAKGALTTLTSGTLTFGTDEPVYEPWFVDDEPANGKGFESAVAYAVAKQLGYAADSVTWTRVSFNAAIQPGPKTFDAAINEFSITPERKQAVDFSSSYYDVTQAIVAMESSAAAKVTTLAGLKGLELGAQLGSTSYTAITQQIQPTQKPAVFNTNDEAKLALQNGQIDALVLDTPTAFYVTSAELDDSTIVGQLPAAGGTPEQFGFVLDQGTPLTACVSSAVDALRADGTLQRLQDTWLAKAGGAPVLQ